jgi:ABC-type oligopeptide transport system ATPase subunit
LITAVNNVSLSIAGGESFGLIGESGSGKSTLGRLILQLLQPTAGDVYYRGRNLRLFSRRELKEIRPKLQPIFQDADSQRNSCGTPDVAKITANGKRR